MTKVWLAAGDPQKAFWIVQVPMVMVMMMVMMMTIIQKTTMTTLLMMMTMTMTTTMMMMTMMTIMMTAIFAAIQIVIPTKLSEQEHSTQLNYSEASIARSRTLKMSESFSAGPKR